jgi:hypothetical protein
MLLNYPLADKPVFIADDGAAGGFCIVFVTCELKIKTEAWMKKVSLVHGKGPYNENSSRAILALADNATVSL